MKRVLVIVPLIALLAGLGLYLWRAKVTGKTPFSFRKESPLAEALNPTAEPKADAATPPPSGAAAPTADTGSIQFIVTSRGEPVKEAKITVQKSGTGYFMNFKTDAQGKLLLGALPPHEYGVGVEHPDYAPYDGELRVVAGKTHPLAIDLKPGGKIYGTVTDKSGHPLPKTRVFLLRGDSGAAMPNSQVETDENGAYAIKAIPAGLYGVRFRHKLYKPQDRKEFSIRSHTDEHRVDVTLEVGARITGRVVDTSGKPIEGAVIVASNKGAAGLEKTAKDGTFLLGGLNELPVNCSATKEGYGKGVMRGLPPNGPDVEFRLAKGGTVAGRVVLDEPPRQVQVVLSKYDEQLQMVIMEESKLFADPPNGAFSVPDVAPGTYWVDVQIGGYEAVERPQVVVGEGQAIEGLVITFRKKP